MAKNKSPGKKTITKSDEDETKEGQEGSEDSENNEDDDGDDSEAENRRINAIVTSRVKREMKQVNATLQAMQETLKSLAAAPKKDEESDEDDSDDSTETKKEAQVDPKLSRKMTKLERELADERAARKKAEQERTEELERSKKNEMRSVFSSALQELGVTDPKLLRAAVNVLEEDGVMIRDEDGKIKFKGVDKYGIETNFDPKSGLKTWVAGEGKSFVPAIEAGGSGTGAARGTGNGSTALTARDIKKLSPQQLASINLQRACSGQPPLGVDE